ncbi:MAG: isoprenylcysteine carboxylmethyltransferase family protein [Acidobacteriota bacterium]|nr:isoprenylcysteine carboxylmethyltransferase family protein [Acidobacteriota bacterium]
MSVLPLESNLILRRGGTWIQRWRVPLGFLCAALFLLFARPNSSTLIAGATVSVLGLLLRAWASGHIRKNDALAISGPYAYTRNPLYLGSFLLGLGFTIGSGRWLLAFLFVALFVGIYLPVMRVESATLSHLFGETFRQYAQDVPLFLPRVSRYRSGELRRKFDCSLYMRYREYRAALGLLLAWGFLILKAYYLQ